jgi:hypothetical protein
VLSFVLPDQVSWSVGSALTKCHGLGGLFTIGTYFSQFWRNQTREPASFLGSLL